MPKQGLGVMLEAAQSKGNGVGWQWPARMLDAYYDDYRRLARRVLSGDNARNLMLLFAPSACHVFDADGVRIADTDTVRQGAGVASLARAV